jgi:hypothetical protein
MVLGKPVIATGQSGVIDFCRPRTSLLTPERKHAGDGGARRCCRGSTCFPEDKIGSKV